MKNLTRIFLIVLYGLNFNPPAFAQEIKIIKLKDGSVINGKVLDLNSGVYTFETPNMGSVQIAETDVLSISSPSAHNIQQPNVQASGSSQNSLIQSQVNQLQGTILSDGNLMKEIENLSNDEEIQKIISDPQLMDAVMSFDKNKIEQNQSIQNLLNNPKIQDLIRQIEQKLPAAE